MSESLQALVARLDSLEIRVAYQDQTIEDLNTALSLQWQEIDRLKREVARLEGQLHAAAEIGSGPGMPEPPPPHY
jgi:SlyX protein